MVIDPARHYLVYEDFIVSLSMRRASGEVVAARLVDVAMAETRVAAKQPLVIGEEVALEFPPTSLLAGPTVKARVAVSRWRERDSQFILHCELPQLSNLLLAAWLDTGLFERRQWNREAVQAPVEVRFARQTERQPATIHDRSSGGLQVSLVAACCPDRLRVSEPVALFTPGGPLLCEARCRRRVAAGARVYLGLQYAAPRGVEAMEGYLSQMSVPVKRRK